MMIDKKRDAFLVVDLQNDFCSGGALAVSGGDLVAAPVNALLPRFEHVAASQDWHPRGHVSFASSWPGKKPYDLVEASGVAQTLWPEHCLQGTRGAAFLPAFQADRATLILRKGFRRGLDSYSCFFENDRSTPTGLDGWLNAVGARRLFVAGLATDYCVKFSVLDARRLGLEVVIVEDAIRAVDLPPGSAEEALRAMRDAGAAFAASGDIV
jgi:nicotinamidase/pyrazinamidase